MRRRHRAGEALIGALSCSYCATELRVDSAGACVSCGAHRSRTEGARDKVNATLGALDALLGVQPLRAQSVRLIV